MKKIILNSGQLELLKVEITPMIGEDHKDKIPLWIKAALGMEEIPIADQITETSKAETIEGATDEFYGTEEESEEERAAQRRGIDLCTDKETLVDFTESCVYDATFECLYAIRKMAQLLFPALLEVNE